MFSRHFFIINQLEALTSRIYFGMKLYMFRTVPLSTIRSLFTVHAATLVPSWSCSKAVYKPVWHIPLLSVEWMNSWWWTEEMSETCRVSCQNKFEKLVHLFGFIIKNVIIFAPHPHLHNVKEYTRWRQKRFQSCCLLLTLFPFSDYNAVIRWIREKLAVSIL